MGDIYPDKEEALAKKLLFKPETIKAVLGWKTGKWAVARKLGEEAKRASLAELAEAVSRCYGKTAPSVTFDENLPQLGAYERGAIVLRKASIITLLHEVYHHVHGADERKAVSWSAQLFIRCFPKAAAELQWNGHTLSRKEEHAAGN